MAPLRKISKSSGYEMIRMAGRSYSGEFGWLRSEVLLRALDIRWLEKAKVQLTRWPAMRRCNLKPFNFKHFLLR